MASLSGFDVVTVVALGLPPSHEVRGGPVGVVGSIAIIGFIVLAFWSSVRLLAWFDAKLSTRQLLHEIYCQLGIGGRPRR